MPKISFSIELTLSVLIVIILDSSNLSADALTDKLSDQLVEGVAELKSKPERSGPILLISQSELNALPSDTPVSWSQKPVSPEGPLIEISDTAENLSRQIFTVTVK